MNNILDNLDNIKNDPQKQHLYYTAMKQWSNKLFTMIEENYPTPIFVNQVNGGLHLNYSSSPTILKQEVDVNHLPNNRSDILRYFSSKQYCDFHNIADLSSNLIQKYAKQEQQNGISESEQSITDFLLTQFKEMMYVQNNRLIAASATPSQDSNNNELIQFKRSLISSLKDDDANFNNDKCLKLLTHLEQVGGIGFRYSAHDLQNQLLQSDIDSQYKVASIVVGLSNRQSDSDSLNAVLQSGLIDLLKHGYDNDYPEDAEQSRHEVVTQLFDIVQQYGSNTMLDLMAMNGLTLSVLADNDSLQNFCKEENNTGYFHNWWFIQNLCNIIDQASVNDDNQFVVCTHYTYEAAVEAKIISDIRNSKTLSDNGLKGDVFNYNSVKLNSIAYGIISESTATATNFAYDHDMIVSLDWDIRPLTHDLKEHIAYSDYLSKPHVLFDYDNHNDWAPEHGVERNFSNIKRQFIDVADQQQLNEIMDIQPKVNGYKPMR